MLYHSQYISGLSIIYCRKQKNLKQIQMYITYVAEGTYMSLMCPTSSGVKVLFTN